MANDYRILDERDIKNFQAGNKLEVTEIGNKVTYEHIGEPPDRLPSKEQALEYGKSFDITVPSVYDSTGHVKSETTYSFKMPDKVDTSSSLTVDNFAANTPIRVNKNGNNITYSHDTSGIKSTPTEEEITPDDNNIISLTVLSAADGYGHATEQKTYKFQMPKAPESPDIPNINKVKLTDDVTGEGTFSNGICTISTKLQANPVKGINITGAVTGTGTETNGNWTVNTQLAHNQWILESQIFTTGDSSEDFIIDQDISKNILISCFFVIGNVNTIENGVNTYGISDNFNIIIPVQQLTSLKTLEYSIKLPLIKVSNNGTKIDLIGNSGAFITFSYNKTSKKMTIRFPGHTSGHFKVQGLL